MSGSRNSSNSNRLVDVARAAGADSHLIDNETEVREEWLDGARVVGISSGASAPEELVQRLTDWLYPLALSLWAFVVAGHPRTNRQGTGPGMTIGLLGALGLKALSIYTLSLANIDLRLQAVSYALPILAVAFNIVLIARRVSVSQLFVVERAGDWLDGVGRALRRLPGVRVAAGPVR